MDPQLIQALYQENLDYVEDPALTIHPGNFGESGGRFSFTVFYVYSRIITIMVSDESSSTMVTQFQDPASPFNLDRNQIAAVYRIDAHGIEAPLFTFFHHGTLHRVETYGELCAVGATFARYPDLAAHYGVFVSLYLEDCQAFQNGASERLRSSVRDHQRLSVSETVVQHLRSRIDEVEQETQQLRNQLAVTVCNVHQEESDPIARYISPVVPYDQISEPDVSTHNSNVKSLPSQDTAIRPDARVVVTYVFTDPTNGAILAFRGNDMGDPNNARLHFAPSAPHGATPSRYPPRYFTFDRSNANANIVIGHCGVNLRRIELGSGIRLAQFKNSSSSVDIYLGDHPVYQARGQEAIQAAVDLVQRSIQEQLPKYISYLEHRVREHYSKLPTLDRYLAFTQSLRVSVVVENANGAPITRVLQPIAPATLMSPAPPAPTAAVLSQAGVDGVVVPVPTTDNDRAPASPSAFLPLETTQ